MVWYGMVWYGMVWYGMVWYGMVWYGMVWYGMVWWGDGMAWHYVIKIITCLETTLRTQYVLAAMQPPSYKVYKIR